MQEHRKEPLPKMVNSNTSVKKTINKYQPSAKANKIAKKFTESFEET